MIDDISKLTGNQGTGSLNADLLQKYLKEQDLQTGKGNQPSAQSELLGKIFEGLGAVIQPQTAAQSSQATSSAASKTEDPEVAKLRAELAERVRRLIAEADALQAALDLSPIPDSIDVGELFAEFGKIMRELDKEMTALQKKIEDGKDKDVYKLKPTALHDEAPNAVPGDGGFSKKITTDVR